MRLAMYATLVYLAASLRVSPTRLRPRFLPPLSLYSFPSSLLPFPFFLPALVSLLNVAPLSFVLHASTRKTAGALLSSSLLSSLSLSSREQCSSTLVCRDLNLDKFRSHLRESVAEATRHTRPFHRRDRRGGEERIPSPEVDELASLQTRSTHGNAQLQLPTDD